MRPSDKPESKDSGKNNRSRLIHTPAEGQKVFTFWETLLEGKVIDRPNRFLVNIMAEGGPLKCHIHDPGRLKELIFPGNSILYRPTSGIKTSHSVTAALDNGHWILTDTRIHSAVASAFLPEDAEREVRIGNHRIDFRHGDALIEVKGCTMLQGNTATFPDAPTKRGREHLGLLREHVREGNRAVIIILTFRKDAKSFQPNEETDPAFAEEFRLALRDGVEYFIPRFSFENGSVVYHGDISPEKRYLP